MAENTKSIKGNKKHESVTQLYQNRFKLLRRGQEYSQNNNVPKATEYYRRYLSTLAAYFGIKEAQLTPKLFDPKKDLAELLLISHVYWDLAKSYDRSNNLHQESVRCLNQFVKFTTGYKYQHVNARMLKSFIKKKSAYHPKTFKETYEQIQVESKGCFIASDIYGSNDPKTQRLRHLKQKIQRWPLGTKFCELYYQKICPLYFSFHTECGNILKNPIKRILDLFLFLLP